jgi:hypothetical protein
MFHHQVLHQNQIWRNNVENIKNEIEKLEIKNSIENPSEKEINLKDLMIHVQNSKKSKEIKNPTFIENKKEIKIPEKENKKIPTLSKQTSSEEKKKKIEEMFKKMKNFTT